MNPITAPKAGVVKSIIISNAQPVEYGEALVIIE
jgi:acetyl-CoA carboxylase biotin carboxyl carrier protein